MDDKLTSPTTIKKIIQHFGFRFSRSLGQNFLIDENILNKIVEAAELKKDDVVLEVGPGLGTMTRKLASRAAKVVGVEIDKSLIPILTYTLKTCNNVEIINDDFLKLSLNNLIDTSFKGRNIKVLANLPYYITSPIIMKLLENHEAVELMVFLVQKEVAERITAGPGSRDYGVLSVIVQFFCEARLVSAVPRTVFMPKPKIDSAILKLIPYKKILYDVGKESFFKVVKASFAYRRKTIYNSLKKSQGQNLSPQKIKEILQTAGIDETRRAEHLSIKEFARLAKAFEGCLL